MIDDLDMPQVEGLVLIPLQLDITSCEMISSNLEEFDAKLREAVSQINPKPETDDDFVLAEQQVKSLSKVENYLKIAINDLMRRQEPIQYVYSTLSTLKGDLADIRKQLAKQIDNRKTEIKRDRIEEALRRIDTKVPAHLAPCRAELEQAIKGVRTVSSLESRLSQAVDQINGNIHKVRDLVEDFNFQISGSGVFFDEADYEMMRPESVAVVLKTEYDKRLLAIKAAEARKQAESRKVETTQQQPAQAAQPKAAAEPIVSNDSYLTPLQPEPKTQPTQAADRDPAEMRSFVQAVITAFSGLGAAKRQVSNGYNKHRVEAFARDINAAWAKLKSNLQPDEMP